MRGAGVLLRVGVVALGGLLPRVALVAGMGEGAEVPAADAPGDRQAAPGGAAPGAGALSGEEAGKVEDLGARLEELEEAGKYAEAAEVAEEIAAIRRRVQGPGHSEAVDAEWEVRTLKAIAGKSEDEREEYRSARELYEEAEELYRKGKHAEVQPLLEKSVAIWERVLGEEHPDTATGYNNLGSNLHYQGKYAEAQPLLEKALALWKKLLGEEHPHTAMSYNNLGLNLYAQGRYEEALAAWSAGLLRALRAARARAPLRAPELLGRLRGDR